MKLEAVKYGLKFAAWSGLILLVAAGIVGFLWTAKIEYFLGGYGLSFLFVGSNFFVLSRIDAPDFNRFLRFFITSFALRFLAVIAIIFGVISGITEGQFFFTISFIISYICHSVIEIIFIQKTLGSNKN